MCSIFAKPFVILVIENDEVSLKDMDIVLAVSSTGKTYKWRE